MTTNVSFSGLSCHCKHGYLSLKYLFIHERSIIKMITIDEFGLILENNFKLNKMEITIWDFCFYME